MERDRLDPSQYRHSKKFWNLNPEILVEWIAPFAATKCCVKRCPVRHVTRYRFLTQQIGLCNRDLKQTTTATASRTPQKKGLTRRTMALYVRYKSLYISVPFSAKRRREMTNTSSPYFGERERRRLFFRIFFWNWTLELHILKAWASFETDRRTEQIWASAKFDGKI